MTKLTYIGIKQAGKAFHIQNIRLLRDDLSKLSNGKYRLTIEKYRSKASHKQFKYLYGVVYPLSMIALNDAGYEFTNTDEVDIFWKQIYANKEILNRETGEIMKVPQSKSQFNTIDEMTYCNAIRDYCSEYFNTYIPDPDPNYKQKYEQA